MLAILSAATAYRQIQRVIQARRPQLNARGGLPWKRAPAHPAIRSPVQGVTPTAGEGACRHPAAGRDGPRTGRTGSAVDGTPRRGRVDRFQAQQARPVRRALATARPLRRGPGLSRAAGTAPERPAAPPVLNELGLSGRRFTRAAWHCQQNGRVRQCP